MEVEFTREGPIATLSLNRPDKLNALTRDMPVAIAEHVNAVNADPDLRAIVLTGKGRAFCSGADVSKMGHADILATRRSLGDYHHKAILAIANSAKPVIAAVRGHAVGVGFSLALACDLIVASDTAKFSMIFKRIGVVPDGGGLFFLAQRMGVAQAKDLVYTARIVDAAEAKSLGIASRVVADATLEDETRKFATELAESAPLSLMMAKKMFQSLYVPSLEQHLEHEILAQTQMVLSEDHKEGVRAFLEKRPARFVGR
ncbi:MAG: enoyl-CoA hydratase/isomerase family protein [Alphaproteobacteria bacterium]